MKFRGEDLLGVISEGVVVGIEALIVEDIFEETGKSIMTAAIKIRCLKLL